MVVIPCGITTAVSDEERCDLIGYCTDAIELLKEAGFRCHGDFRDNYSPGWKFNHWELKVMMPLLFHCNDVIMMSQGVPLRVEVGPRDKVKGEYVLVGRVNRNHKVTVTREDLEVKVHEVLDQIHHQLFNK